MKDPERASAPSSAEETVVSGKGQVLPGPISTWSDQQEKDGPRLKSMWVAPNPAERAERKGCCSKKRCLFL